MHKAILQCFIKLFPLTFFLSYLAITLGHSIERFVLLVAFVIALYLEVIAAFILMGSQFCVLQMAKVPKSQENNVLPVKYLYISALISIVFLVLFVSRKMGSLSPLIIFSWFPISLIPIVVGYLKYLDLKWREVLNWNRLSPIALSVGGMIGFYMLSHAGLLLGLAVIMQTLHHFSSHA